MTLPHESKEGSPVQGEAKEAPDRTEAAPDADTGLKAEDGAVEQASGASAQDRAAETGSGDGDKGGSE